MNSLLQSFIGGTMIGGAATLLLWLNGRVAGNSGIIAQAFSLQREDRWRVFYVLGLLAGAIVYRFLVREAGDLTYNPSTIGLVISGIMVGYGVRLGSGCTSGHGVCGIARLSPRSIVATVVFMISGMITVWIVRVYGGVWW